MNDTRAQIGAWARWLLVVVLLIAKCYVFDVLIQHSIVSWEIKDYYAKSSIAMLLALTVLFTRKRYPVFILLGLADLWMIANIIYFRAYHLFITWHLFSLASNMDGFWSSVLPYCSWSLLIFPALTLPAAACYLWDIRPFRWQETTAVVLLGLAFSAQASYHRWYNVRAYLPPDESFSWEWMNPIRIPRPQTSHVSENERMAGKYIRYHSILAYPVYMAYDACVTWSCREEKPTLTPEEKQRLQSYLQPASRPAEPEGNLLIILIESFESWLLDATTTDGKPVCPALNAYIASQPVLYVHDVTSQIRYGMSGDGQLIVNTGLLPTLEHVTCVDYGYNTYPNLAHFYPQSAIVNPCRNVWNQTAITHAYGYKHLIEPTTENRFEWNDSIIIDRIINAFENLPSPCCIMGITVSGHLPFDTSPDDIPVADSVPELFRHYMQTAHFTDRQIGRLLTWSDTAAVMQNSTIVITGDHRIFHAEMNDEVRSYGLRADLPFGTGNSCCPLIIRSPRIDSAINVKQGAQADIFPTILDAIGQSDYFWQGVGHNLLIESTGTTEEYDALFHLSDKLIRMDYFKSK